MNIWDSSVLQRYTPKRKLKFNRFDGDEGGRGKNLSSKSKSILPTQTHSMK